MKWFSNPIAPKNQRVSQKNKSTQARVETKGHPLLRAQGENASRAIVKEPSTVAVLFVISGFVYPSFFGMRIGAQRL